MKDRVPSLDGLRGVAVLLVVAGHVAQNTAGIPTDARTWLMGLANASAGVRVFFVLSGYLITRLLLAEHDRSGRIDLRLFYARRVRRIFPAFYVYLAAVIILGLVTGIGLTPSAVLAAGTFTWNYGFLWVEVGAHAYWLLGHLWTLALEQQFYLFWPLILLLAGPRRAGILAGVLLLWCPLARVGSYVLFPEQRGYLGMMLHTGIDSIMAGCALALLVQQPRWRAWFEERGTTTAAFCATWLLVVSPLCSLTFRGFPLAVGYTLDAIAASAFIGVIHLGQKNPLQQGLAAAPLRWVGVISYSLYLWQQFMLTPDALTTPVRVIAAVALAFAAAAGSYYLVEKPFLRASVTLRPTPAVLAANHER